jgi:hypothetical protein
MTIKEKKDLMVIYEHGLPKAIKSIDIHNYHDAKINLLMLKRLLGLILKIEKVEKDAPGALAK